MKHNLKMKAIVSMVQANVTTFTNATRSIDVIQRKRTKLLVCYDPPNIGKHLKYLADLVKRRVLLRSASTLYARRT